MGADYMIGYSCEPKRVFSSEGLLLRVKARDRAETIREFYRSEGEERASHDMGFEMIHRAADGEQETHVIQLDELEAQSADLASYEQHCEGCPANRNGKPFGCIGSVNYPLSIQAEVWMLQQLPGPETPLAFLLLKQGKEMGNTGEKARDLRLKSPGVFFESPETVGREFPEINIMGEQLFELMFLLGSIQPKRAVMILLFMKAIRQDLQADEIMNLTPTPSDAAERVPFLLQSSSEDDPSIRDLKQFFHALHLAFLLDREVILDV